MLQKYKEIFYGGLFGLGAAVLDTFMDAWMEGLSFGDELVQHRPMLFYRVVFVLFGLALGWLLWQKNKRERQSRLIGDSKTISSRVRGPRHSHARKVASSVNPRRSAPLR
jgi:hypothetical protein